VPISAPSTAAAAKLVSTKKGASAAIASRHAASFYGLEVLKDEIQDHEPGGNMTRFLILALTDSPPTGDDKRSLITGLEDRPGSLHAALGIFARYQINMTKIESRPIRGQLGKFLFFIDIQGHRQDKHIARALKELRAESLFVKLLGSYPRTKIFE
jgi:prephenate dehydratase